MNHRVLFAATRRFPRPRTSVGASRDFVAHVLREWQLTGLIEDIALCASELATNALLHGVPPGREFAVRLDLTDDLVRLEVRDSGEGRPEIQHAERGLFLVGELAADFGVDQHVVSKTVWAAFKRPPAT
ncbi:ATP-binding protein [Streptomyces sp. SID10692]|uniref:ATP-binding protein n=1 Tax=Streptomyces sp. SID10692 TaxID=2706026 RepID=UPI000997AF7C|nr:ATP-binding protein [Streptomyces californicus]NEA10006.1 ATP-binding protein [Streptomyces sp. SID10692]